MPQNDRLNAWLEARKATPIWETEIRSNASRMVCYLNNQQGKNRLFLIQFFANEFGKETGWEVWIPASPAIGINDTIRALENYLSA